MKEIKIESKHLKRVFKDKKDGFVTVSYDAKKGKVGLIKTSTSFEGSVKIDGKKYILGGKKPSSLPYISHEVTKIEGKGGEKLEVVFGSTGKLPKGLVVKAIYEAPNHSTVLTKYIRIDNESELAVKLNHIEIESFTPKTDKKATLILESDYVRDGLKVNGKRAYSPWIEHAYVYIDALLRTRALPSKFAYPVQIEQWLVVGSRFNSYKAYEFVASNSDEIKRSVEFRAATRSLFPWTTTRNLSTFTPAANDVQDYYKAIDAASACGLEMIYIGSNPLNGKLTSGMFENYSDYEFNKKLFPKGMEDVKKLTAYAHKKGLGISFYIIYSQTWQGIYGKGPGAYQDNNWELVWPDTHVEKHTQPGAQGLRWGQALDPATDWGKFLIRKLEHIMREGNFDAFHFDGPYYGDVSVTDHFRACDANGPNQVKGWARQSEMYQVMRALGLHGEAAQGFQGYPHGMCRITTSGYEEGDFMNMGMETQILNLRASAYGFLRAFRPEQATTVVQAAPNNMDDPKCPSLMPLEKNANMYDYYLSTVYGYGFEGRCWAKEVFAGPKSKKVFMRWINYWKDHEKFFKQGFALPLRQADGENIDGIIHVLPGKKPKALVVVYNPTKKKLTDTLSLKSLKSVGFPLKGWKVKPEKGKKRFTADGEIKVTVNAMNATWYELVR